MLASLAQLREDILAGEAVAVQTTVWRRKGGASIYLAGACSKDPRRALLDTVKQLLEAPAEEKAAAPEPPQFRSSAM